MLNDLLLHPNLKIRLESQLASPSHAILLSGPDGSGKYALGLNLAAELLNIPKGKVVNHPYVLIIDPPGESIGIDEVRSLQQFLKLKVPGDESKTQRVIIINSVQRMRTEAQNALLKTLEEPPLGTVIILTVQNADYLLPTITSRTNLLQVLPVSLKQANDYFAEKEIQKDKIKNAYALSQGQVGLLTALLNDQDHPLLDYIKQAKQILGLNIRDRLLLTDDLSKDKPRINQLLGALSRITHAAIVATSNQDNKKSLAQWHDRQTAVLEMISIVRHNPNTKLLLDRLFLSI